MKPFKRKTATQTGSTFSAQFGDKIIRKQRKIADYLNKKTEFLSGKALLILLIFFCVIFGSYCLYLISSALKLIH